MSMSWYFFLIMCSHFFILIKDLTISSPSSCSMKKVCDCGHSSVRHFCWWNKVSFCWTSLVFHIICFSDQCANWTNILQYISKPIQWGSASDEGQQAMILLKEKVLKGIVLRRTKIGRAADLAMPPKIVSFSILSLMFMKCLQSTFFQVHT